MIAEQDYISYPKRMPSAAEEFGEGELATGY